MPKNQNIVITKSANAIPLWGHDFPLDANCSNLKLNAGVSQSVTVPDACNVALVSYSAGSSAFVSLAAMALPSTLSNQAAFINKTSLHVRPGETLYFISPSDDYVSVAFFYNADYQLGVE